MRESQLNPSQFQTMVVNNEPKSAMVSVSSNVYYGYHQPLPAQSQDEPMQTEQQQSQSVDPQFAVSGRKRCRTAVEWPPKNWKRHRPNECAKTLPPKRCSPTKTPLEEDLLRETHGCSYYHWISANN